MTETILVPDLEKPWTFQTAFDRIVEWALIEKRPKASKAPGQPCYYRYPIEPPYETACFAGCLIPDSVLDPKWNGSSADALPTYLEPETYDSIFDPKVDQWKWDSFLVKLQSLHDKGPDTEEGMVIRLTQIARYHGLSTKVLENAMGEPND